LSEYRVKVSYKYAFCGVVIFWSLFLSLLVVGVFASWSTFGRGVLLSQFEFLRALWRETMRHHDSVPARWSCRISGYFLHVAPWLAEWVYKRPELPLFVLGCSVTAFIIAVMFFVL